MKTCFRGLFPLLACSCPVAPAFATVFLTSGFMVIDNDPGANFTASGALGGDYGYAVSEEGSWGYYRAWGTLASGIQATWRWGTDAGDPALASGTYEVFASWKAGSQSNLGVARYAGTDGFPSIEVNQDPGASSYASTLGTEIVKDNYGIDTTFVRLGSVSLSDGSFSLSVLGDLGGEFIFLDAAALRAIPEPALFGLLAGAGAFALSLRRRPRRR